jgi:thioredoxin 1
MSESRHVIPATLENFESVVTGSELPVVVDFWASWCGPCVRLAPIYHELAETLSHVRFVSVDVDDEPELAQRFRVTSIPTLKFFQGGQVVETQVGGLTREQLRQKLEAFAPAPDTAGALSASHAR